VFALNNAICAWLLAATAAFFAHSQDHSQDSQACQAGAAATAAKAGPDTRAKDCPDTRAATGRPCRLASPAPAPPRDAGDEAETGSEKKSRVEEPWAGGRRGGLLCGLALTNQHTSALLGPPPPSFPGPPPPPPCPLPPAGVMCYDARVVVSASACTALSHASMCTRVCTRMRCTLERAYNSRKPHALHVCT